MRSLLLSCFLCCSGWVLVGAVGEAQTVEGDILRGQGAFLRGAGAFNLNTAKANSINVDATIRWKQDLRRIQREREYAETQKKYEKSQNVEELHRKMALREQELRLNPSPEDVQSGAALNALVYDLTDPEITSSKWKSRSPVSLPAGTSVKELIFSFTPHSVSTQASAALSRGVIALSRLEIKDKWPVILKKDELAKERKAYEDAYLRVRDKVMAGDYAVQEILTLDAALDGLRKKIAIEIPNERNFRLEATKFVDDLTAATRMFDANSVDYAREILIDTKDHDAANVEELVAFMTKYRLQFSKSDRSPTARVLYGQIYEKLREQANALEIKPDALIVPPIPDPAGGSEKNTKVVALSDPFKAGAVLSGKRKFDGGGTQDWDLRITKRDKEKFTGQLILDRAKKSDLTYAVEGTVNGKSVQFKTERKGAFQQAFEGTLKGDSIDLKFSGTTAPKGKATSGTATLSVKN